MIQIEFEDSLPDGFAEAFKSAVASVQTRKATAHAEYIMRRRTERGEFLEGSSSGASSYSTKPYAQPAGALTDQVRESLPDDEVKYFTTGSDSLWLVIEGGYEAVRRAKGLPTSNVDLTVSGDMLGGMRSASSRDEDGDISMIVGYIDGASPAEAMQLARYHNVEGAGKNEVKRVFVGLTDDEADEVFDHLQKDLLRNL